ncbi:unnamed protein product [Echinostoma caproni]|uniref:DZF domain-containing protein n=1 Tax=Echinostoma caproni TaxID=27848 RepID=A0A3P8I6S9_9TREM|nr:unnamed protein product [Echinostoma caproni]
MITELRTVSPARSGDGRAPFSPQAIPRSFVRPGPPITPGCAYVSPSRLFRRFFEAIASGLLLQLKSSEMPQADEQSIKDDGDFACSLLASTSLELREQVTVLAQLALRQIAFRQLYKVLRIEPTAAQYSYRRRISPDDDDSSKVEQSVNPEEYDEDDVAGIMQSEEMIQQSLESDNLSAPPKRPCIDQDKSSTADSSITAQTKTNTPTGPSTITSSNGVATRSSSRPGTGTKKN